MGRWGIGGNEFAGEAEGWSWTQRRGGNKPGGAAGQLSRCHARRAAEAKPMSDRLSLSQVAALMAYAATTAGGQLLFKTPALRGAVDGPLAPARSGNIRIDSKPLAYCHPSVPGDR